MITSNYSYFPIFFYSISPKRVYRCMNDVSENLNSSIIITTKYVSIIYIFNEILETHKPNTTGCQFTNPIHHHLSHRHNIYDQRIVYQHQSTYLLITNEHSINPHNHSQFITFFVTSIHLYEFNILLPIKIKSNVYVIIECERTQTTTNVMHYLQQPLSASQDVTTQLVLESGWVSFTNSNTHHLNSHHHLTFSKNC